ncbi:hypothetical protein ABTX61_09215 [Amycolatopsis japonica]|uniref:hypothetical protein n=1 Tax=Amycolatopsis japonica TaxID=208439 RepID=UPI003320E9B6
MARIKRGIDQKLSMPQAGEAFDRSMRPLVDGSPNLIGELAAGTKGISDGCRKIALDIEYAKYSAVGQLFLLAYEIAMEYALASFTGGASLANLTWHYALTRNYLLILFKMLVRAISFEVFIGVTGGLLIDAAVQRLQHERTEWDSAATSGTLVSGVVGGVLGGAVGEVGEKLGRKVGGLLGKDFTSFVSDDLLKLVKDLKLPGGGAVPDEWVRDVGRVLADRAGRQLRDPGSAFTKGAVDAFADVMAGRFAVVFGRDLGDGVARQLGRDYARSFVDGWSRHGLDGSGVFGERLRGVLGPHEGVLGGDAVGLLTETVPGVLARNVVDRLGGNLAARAAEFSTIFVFEGVSGVMSQAALASINGESVSAGDYAMGFVGGVVGGAVSHKLEGIGGAGLDAAVKSIKASFAGLNDTVTSVPEGLLKNLPHDTTTTTNDIATTPITTTTPATTPNSTTPASTTPNTATPNTAPPADTKTAPNSDTKTPTPTKATPAASASQGARSAQEPSSVSSVKATARGAADVKTTSVDRPDVESSAWESVPAVVRTSSEVGDGNDVPSAFDEASVYEGAATFDAKPAVEQPPVADWPEDEERPKTRPAPLRPSPEAQAPGSTPVNAVHAEPATTVTSTESLSVANEATNGQTPRIELDLGKSFVEDLFDGFESGVTPAPRTGVLREQDWTSPHPGGGEPLTPQRLIDEFGFPLLNQQRFQWLADWSNVVFDVRPTNPDSVRWLELGAVPKPKDIKAKTVSELDTYLGASPDSIGLVGYFEPRLPDDLSELPPDVKKKVQARFANRAKEFAALADEMEQLANQGRYRVVDGIVQARVEGEEYRPITGDHDVYHVRCIDDGSSLTTSDYNSVVDLLTKRNMGVQHGAHMYWTPEGEFQEKIFNDIVERHQADAQDAEPLIRFDPGKPPRLVFADPLPSQVPAAVKPNSKPTRARGDSGKEKFEQGAADQQSSLADSRGLRASPPLAADGTGRHRKEASDLLPAGWEQRDESPSAPGQGPPSSLDMTADEHVQKVSNLLARAMRERDGDLHLTAVESLVEQHPDPDFVWYAALKTIIDDPALASAVKTITYQRREGDTIRAVRLPDAVWNILGTPNGTIQENHNEITAPVEVLSPLPPGADISETWRRDAASWSDLLDEDASGHDGPSPDQLATPGFPATRSDAWASLLSARHDLARIREAHRELLSRLGPGGAGSSRDAGRLADSESTLDAALDKVARAAADLKAWGNDPSRLDKLFQEWRERSVKERPRHLGGALDHLVEDEGHDDASESHGYAAVTASAPAVEADSRMSDSITADSLFEALVPATHQGPLGDSPSSGDQSSSVEPVPPTDTNRAVEENRRVEASSNLPSAPAGNLAETMSEDGLASGQAVGPAGSTALRHELLFDEGSKELSAAALSAVDEIAAEVVKVAVRRRARGLPVPEVAVVGFGNGGAFGAARALRTGQARADVVNSALSAAIGRELRKLRGKDSGLVAADLEPVAVSRGRDLGDGNLPEGMTKQQARRRAVVTVDLEPAWRSPEPPVLELDPIDGLGIDVDDLFPADSESADGSLVLNPAEQGMVFSASRGVVEAANARLALVGSEVRLKPVAVGADSVVGPDGRVQVRVVREKRTVLADGSVHVDEVSWSEGVAGPEDAAKVVMGGQPRQAVLRGAGGVAAMQSYVSAGVEGCTDIAHALAASAEGDVASRISPLDVVASIVKDKPKDGKSASPSPEAMSAIGKYLADPGASANMDLAAKRLGVGRHAEPRVGEAYVLAPIGEKSESDANLDQYFGAVVAESTDGLSRLVIEVKPLEKDPARKFRLRMIGPGSGESFQDVFTSGKSKVFGTALTMVMTGHETTGQYRINFDQGSVVLGEVTTGTEVLRSIEVDGGPVDVTRLADPGYLGAVLTKVAEGVTDDSVIDARQDAVNALGVKVAARGQLKTCVKRAVALARWRAAEGIAPPQLRVSVRQGNGPSGRLSEQRGKAVAVALRELLAEQLAVAGDSSLSAADFDIVVDVASWPGGAEGPADGDTTAEHRQVTVTMDSTMITKSLAGPQPAEPSVAQSADEPPAADSPTTSPTSDSVFNALVAVSNTPSPVTDDDVNVDPRPSTAESVPASTVNKGKIKAEDDASLVELLDRLLGVEHPRPLDVGGLLRILETDSGVTDPIAYSGAFPSTRSHALADLLRAREDLSRAETALRALRGRQVAGQGGSRDVERLAAAENAVAEAHARITQAEAGLSAWGNDPQRLDQVIAEWLAPKAQDTSNPAETRLKEETTEVADPIPSQPDTVNATPAAPSEAQPPPSPRPPIVVNSVEIPDARPNTVLDRSVLPPAQHTALGVHGLEAVLIGAGTEYDAFWQAVGISLPYKGTEEHRRITVKLAEFVAHHPGNADFDELARAAEVRVHVLQIDGTWTSYGPDAGRPVHILRANVNGRSTFLGTRENVHIGRSGVSYPGSTIMQSGGGKRSLLHRGEFEIETIKGEHFVRIYTAVLNPAPPMTSHKDVHQNEDGDVAIYTGATPRSAAEPESQLWAGGGRTLRAIQWAAKYEHDTNRTADMQPVLRSFLVPLDTFTAISKETVPEGAAHGERLSTNVDQAGDSNQFGLRGKQLESLRSAAVKGSLVTYSVPGKEYSLKERAGRRESITDLYRRLGIDPEFNSAALGFDNDPWFSWSVTGGKVKKAFRNDPAALRKLADDLTSHYHTWKGSPESFFDPAADSIPGVRDQVAEEKTTQKKRRSSLNVFLNTYGPPAVNLSQVVDHIGGGFAKAVRDGVVEAPTADPHLLKAEAIKSAPIGRSLDDKLSTFPNSKAVKRPEGSLETGTLNGMREAISLSQFRKHVIDVLAGDIAKRMAANVMSHLEMKHLWGPDVKAAREADKASVAERERKVADLQQELKKPVGDVFKSCFEKLLQDDWGKALDNLKGGGKSWLGFRSDRAERFLSDLADTFRSDPVIAQKFQDIDRSMDYEIFVTALEERIVPEVVNKALGDVRERDLVSCSPSELRALMVERLPVIFDALSSGLVDHTDLSMVSKDYLNDVVAKAILAAEKGSAEALEHAKFETVDPAKVEAFMKMLPDFATQARIGESIATDVRRSTVDFNMRETIYEEDEVKAKPFPNDFGTWRESYKAGYTQKQDPRTFNAHRVVGDGLVVLIDDVLVSPQGDSAKKILDRLVSEVDKLAAPLDPLLKTKFSEVVKIEGNNKQYRAAGKTSPSIFGEHAQMVLNQYLRLVSGEHDSSRFLRREAIVKAILFHDMDKVNSKNMYGDGQGRHDREPEHRGAVEQMNRHEGLWSNERDFRLARAMVDSDPFGFYFRGKIDANAAYEFIANLAKETGNPDGSVPTAEDIRRFFREFHQYYQADFSSYTSDVMFVVEETGELVRGIDHGLTGLRRDAHGALIKLPGENRFAYLVEAGTDGRPAGKVKLSYEQKYLELAGLFDEAVEAERSARLEGLVKES